LNSKSVLWIILKSFSFRNYLFLWLQILFFNNGILQAQWVHTNGPFGGEARALVISGNNFFACVDGDVYMSSNNGNNWKVTNLVHSGVNSLAAINGLILAGAGGAGIFLSSDDGNNWAPANNGLPAGNLNVSTMVAIGHDLYVYIANSIVSQPGYGIFRSTDFGSSWLSANNGLTGNSYVNSIAVVQDVFDKKTLYAGRTNGIMISTNNGDSWISDGLENKLVSSLAVISDGIGGSNIFAGTRNGVFLSTGSGSSWIPVNSGMNDTIISALAVSPNNSGGTNILAGTEGGNLYISSNNGSTWNTASTGLLSGPWGAGASINSFTVAGSNIYACTIAGLFQSDNNTFNWKPNNDGIPLTAVHALLVSSNGPGNSNILAGTFPSGVFFSTNYGSNWTAINNGINSVNITAFTTYDKNIYAGGQTGVFLSTNNGSVWNNIGLVNSSEVVSLFAAPDGSGHTTILAGTWNGLYRSTNNGGNWDNIMTNIVSAFAISPLDSSIFAATQEGVLMSTDLGITWNSRNTGLPLSNINELAFSGSNLFASTLSALYLSTDNGFSWNPTALQTTGNTYIYSISVNSNGIGETDIFVGTNTGLIVSTNNGSTWYAANSGLTDTCIYSLAISGTYLLAGTNLSGVWKRQLSELESIHEIQPQILQQFSLSQNYPNPFNPSTVIPYSLPSASSIKLIIYNTLGQTIKILENGFKNAGNYSVNFSATDIPSGIYFYKLKAGQFTQVKKMILVK
jgi:hypothetical protein